VASPRKTRKPIESVTIVTNTDEATAGSAPARSSPSGTNTPARPAIRMLVIIAAAITPPSIGLEKASDTPIPISTAMVTPFSSATLISRAIALGVVKEGQRFYLPGQDVTRGQMATFIVNTLRAAGIDAELPAAPEEDAFPDIAESPHRNAINVLAEAGIVTGLADGSFAPEAPVSRAQMATFMLKAADFAIEPDLASVDGARFTDVPAGSTHAERIERGADNGLFRGVTPTTFAPEKMVPRDQMASFLRNLLERIDA